MKIGIKYVSMDGNTGYGVAARRYLRGLDEAKVNFSWTPMRPGNRWKLGYQPYNGSSTGDDLLGFYCNREIDYQGRPSSHSFERPTVALWASAQYPRICHISQGSCGPVTGLRISDALGDPKDVSGQREAYRQGAARRNVQETRDHISGCGGEIDPSLRPPKAMPTLSMRPST